MKIAGYYQQTRIGGLLRTDYTEYAVPVLSSSPLDSFGLILYDCTTGVGEMAVAVPPLPAELQIPALTPMNSEGQASDTAFTLAIPVVSQSDYGYIMLLIAAHTYIRQWRTQIQLRVKNCLPSISLKDKLTFWWGLSCALHDFTPSNHTRAITATLLFPQKILLAGITDTPIEVSAAQYYDSLPELPPPPIANNDCPPANTRNIGLVFPVPGKQQWWAYMGDAQFTKVSTPPPHTGFYEIEQHGLVVEVGPQVMICPIQSWVKDANICGYAPQLSSRQNTPLSPCVTREGLRHICQQIAK